MGSLSLTHWLIVLVIVVLVFGTKRLGNVGKDLGEAIKGFKKGVRDEPDERGPPAQLRDDRPGDGAAPADSARTPAAPRDGDEPR